ncbi:hypothetical protein A3742_28030 [Oleiphilus sp. HI0071]|nr:hypothetical protein A3742_28030 [Oleiphilus sp. HI0071]
MINFSCLGVFFGVAQTLIANSKKLTATISATLGCIDFISGWLIIVLTRLKIMFFIRCLEEYSFWNQLLPVIR